MKFILTIDTEGDNQWDHGRKLTVENIKFIPRFQELCDKYMIKPTYLVTSEVCDDPYARRLFSGFLSSGTAEVGAHLHSWTTPPFEDKKGLSFNDINHSFATDLDEALLAEKLKNLTEQIGASFGRYPTSFRSGRYGFNTKVAELLVNNSYLVDSSVTPYTDWSKFKGTPDGQGGPDFTQDKPFPYKYLFSSRTLLEIPITILPTMFPLNRSHLVARYYFKNVDNNVLLRVFRKLAFSQQPLWLRPLNFMNMELYDELVREAVRIDLPFLVMMFHSSELMPGCSIYRKDKEAVEDLYRLLGDFFRFINNNNIGALTLTEAAQNWE